MRRFWDQVFSSRRTRYGGNRGGPEPERLTYAVGDVHGSHDLLAVLLEQIDKDRAGRDADVVLMGDYVDRGPDSAGVLRTLYKLQQDFPDNTTCLLGNHDRMMLEFLKAPSEETAHWLHFGGAETLTSFGVTQAMGPDLGSRLVGTADRLRKAIGQEVLTWLEQAPLWWKSGNLIAVHAGTDPELLMPQQIEEVLLWKRPERVPVPREDGCWVVHGHTVVPAPLVSGRHIAVDTGAWRTGRLTAAAMDGENIRFLSVRK